jgi:hypothetical protein
MEDIETFFENPSFFEYMSSSNMLTIDMLKKYPDSPWNWDRVSRNGKITYEDMKNNSNLKWNWKLCSVNPNITWDMVKGDKNLDICWFTANPNFKLEYFWENPELDWDWRVLVIDHNILEKMKKFDIVLFFKRCIYLTNKSWGLGGGEWERYYILRDLFKTSWGDTTFYKRFSEKLPIDFLETFYKFLLDYISRHAEFKIFLENLDFSDREDITLEIIQKCPKLKWNWEKIFKRFSQHLKIK